MQREWHSANILPTMVHGREKSKSTKEVFYDAKRVALTIHITHYGPREGKIKIYKRYFMMQEEWYSSNILPTMVHGREKSKSTKEVFHDAKRVALTIHITH